MHESARWFSSTSLNSLSGSGAASCKGGDNVFAKMDPAPLLGEHPKKLNWLPVRMNLAGFDERLKVSKE